MGKIVLAFLTIFTYVYNNNWGGSVINFNKKYICGNVDEVEKKIVLFSGKDVVIVTTVVGSLTQVKCITSQYEAEGRTFAFIKVSKEGYLIVREVEEDYTYKSPVTGEDVFMSDYTYPDKKPRCIVSKACPDGELIRFWLKGDPVYFKMGD